MLSVERHRVDRVSLSVTLGPPHWHRGSFLIPSPIASEFTMLHAMLAKKNPEEKRPKLCYHAKFHGKLPFYLGQTQDLSQEMAQGSSKVKGVEKLLLSSSSIFGVGLKFSFFG